MKLLLTGGTGFFGKALLRHWQFSQSVPEVYVLSREPERFLAANPEFSQLPWLNFIRGDVSKSETLPQAECFSHVIHAAADSTFGPQLSAFAQFDQIVNGTRNMLDLAAHCRVQRFLFVSSGAVYGALTAECTQQTENWLGGVDPLSVTNTYAVAKRSAEHLCAIYYDKYRIPIVIARCFAFVGEDLPLDVHFAIGNFIRDAVWGESVQVNGDGSPVRSYLDQRDLAHWLLKLLMQATPGQAYNVGSDQAITIADLAYLVRDLVAPNKPVKIQGVGGGKQLRSVYVPNIQKIQSELGVQVSVSLSDAITHTAAAVRERISQHSVRY